MIPFSYQFVAPLLPSYAPVAHDDRPLMSIPDTAVTLVIPEEHVVYVPPVDDAVVAHRPRALVIDADDDIAHGRAVRRAGPDGIPIAALGLSLIHI